MSSYHTLCQLTGNLNKAEKRELTKSFLKKKDKGAFNWIYHHLLKFPDDIQRFQKDFKKAFPDKSLSSAMNHFYASLINFLIIMDKKDDVENRIIHLLLEIKVLFARGMTNECFQLTIKARKICQKSELYQWQYLLFRLELMLRMHTNYLHLTESELIYLHSEISNTLLYLQTLSRHQRLYDLLRLRRSGIKEASLLSINQNLDDLVMQEQQIFSSARYTSFEAEKLHLMFQFDYFLAKGNLAACHRVFQTLDKHFETYPQLMQHPGKDYLSHLSGVLQALHQSEDFKGMLPILAKLENWISEASENVVLAQIMFLHYRILIFLKTDKIKEAVKDSLKAELFLQKPFAPFTYEESMLLRLSVAIVFFVTKNYKKAGHHLQSCYSRKTSINQFPVLYTAKWLALLIHFDQGDYDVMEANIRSFKRNLKKFRCFGAEEEALFNLLKGLPVQKQTLGLRLQATLDLVDISSNGLMKQSIVFYNWHHWLLRRVKDLAL